MNTPLRVNEALLITGRAFQPLQCIAWAAQDGHGELSITVVDRTQRPLERTRLSHSTYRDPQQLAAVLHRSRDQLQQQGVDLAPWNMPELG